MTITLTKKLGLEVYQVSVNGITHEFLSLAQAKTFIMRTK